MPAAGHRGALGRLTFGVLAKFARQYGEFGGILQSVEKAMWNTGKTDLCSDESAGENAARLILSPAVEGIEHSLLEVIVKARREIVGRWEAGDRSRKAFRKRWRPSMRVRS